MPRFLAVTLSAFFFVFVLPRPSPGQWALQIGGPERDRVTDLFVNEEGDIYLTGTFHEQINLGGPVLNGTGPAPLFLARLNYDGTHLWSLKVDGDFFPGASLVVNPTGTLFLSGIFEGDVDLGDGLLQGDSFELFFARYNIDGALFGVQAGGGTGQKQVNGLGLTPEGQATVVGAFNGRIELDNTPLQGTDGGTDFFLATYQDDGDLLRAVAFGGAAEDHPLDAVLDASGRTYVTGFFSLVQGSIETNLGGGTLQGTDQEAFLAAYNPSGTHVWSQAFGGPGNETGTTLTAAPDGGVYLAGTFENTFTLGTSTFQSRGAHDVFLARFDASGTLLWIQQWGGEGNDRVNDLAVAPDGLLYTTGRFEHTAQFGPSAETSAGAADVFLARLNPDGTVLGVSRYGGSAADAGLVLAFDADGNLHLAGTFEGTIDLGFGPLASAGDADIFVAQIEASQLRLVATDDPVPVAPSVELAAPFPNPFSGTTQFSLTVPTAQHVQVAAYDLHGRRVAVLHDGRLAPGRAHDLVFDAGDLPAGVYLLRATGETFTASRPVLRMR